MSPVAAGGSSAAGGTRSWSKCQQHLPAASQSDFAARLLRARASPRQHHGLLSLGNTGQTDGVNSSSEEGEFRGSRKGTQNKHQGFWEALRAPAGALPFPLPGWAQHSRGAGSLLIAAE